MTNSTSSNTLLTPLTRMMLIGGGFVIIVAGLRAASEVVNLILLAYIITLLTAPLYRKLIGWRVPSFIAILLILLIFVAIILALSAFLAVSLSRLEANLVQYQSALMEDIYRLVEWFAQNGPSLTAAASISDSIDFAPYIGNLFGFVTRILSGFVNMFSNIGLVVLIVFFALSEVMLVPQRLTQGLASNNALLPRFYRLHQDIRTYFWIKTQTGFLTAVANTILLFALGVDFALLWGLLSFLFNFIPNIGFIIALIPAAIMAFLEFGVGKALLVVAGYIIINFIVDNILSPKLMGRGLNLSPAVVFIALIFWAWVLGLLGAILAVPFMIILKAILDSDPDARWLSLVISGDNPDSPS